MMDLEQKARELAGFAVDSRDVRGCWCEDIAPDICWQCTVTGRIVTALREARAEGAREMRERAAMLHESIGNECDFDRTSPGTPAGTAGKVCGCGAMGTVIEYRDAIRALPIEEASR